MELRFANITLSYIGKVEGPNWLDSYLAQIGIDKLRVPLGQKVLFLPVVSMLSNWIGLRI